MKALPSAFQPWCPTLKLPSCGGSPNSATLVASSCTASPLSHGRCCWQCMGTIAVVVWTLLSSFCCCCASNIGDAVQASSLLHCNYCFCWAGNVAQALLHCLWCAGHCTQSLLCGHHCVGIATQALSCRCCCAGIAAQASLHGLCCCHGSWYCHCAGGALLQFIFARTSPSIVAIVTLATLQGQCHTRFVRWKLLLVPSIAIVAVIAVVVQELLLLLCRIPCHGLVVLAIVACKSKHRNWMTLGTMVGCWLGGWGYQNKKYFWATLWAWFFLVFGSFYA